MITATGKKRCRRLWVILAVILTVTAWFCPASFAAGDGSGGGGGAIIPLYMDWSYPADGASGVSVTPVIQCKFSHNVAQYNVSNRNKTLISLKKADGTNVDITVFVADTQLQFDKRQFLYVSPVKPLSYGTKYILTLHEGIQAKNNMATDEEQTITFTTEYSRSSFNAPFVTPPVHNELNTPKGDGEAGNSDESLQGGGVLSKDDGGSGSGTADSKDSKISPRDEADMADSSTDSPEKSAADGSPASSQDSENNAGADFGLSRSVKVALTMLLLFLTAVGGGIFSSIWLKKKTKAPAAILGSLQINENDNMVFSGKTDSLKKKAKKKRSAGADRSIKHISILLAAVLVVSGAAAGLPLISHAAVPENFTVRLKIGDQVVSEKVYTDAQLRGMKQTRQTYSGINEEGFPCTVAAEGILLSDLVKSQGADASEIESISIYGSGNWVRNMTKNYLYGVKRYRYPHLSEAYRMEKGIDLPSKDGGSSVETPGDSENPPNGDSGGVSAVKNPADPQNPGELSGQQPDPSVLKKSDPERTAPMLALRSVSSQLKDEVSYDSLSSIEGYRFCFGQLNPSDGAYLMYGYNLRAIDIKMSAAGEFAEKMGMQDKEGRKKKVPGGADSVGSADVKGPYTDPFTGKTTDHLPNELTVQVGYFGTEYYTVKKFSFDELAAMPLVRQAYSSVSSDGKNGIMTAMGVRLVDLITAAGIDVESVEKIGFYQGGGEDSPGVTASKAYLLDMNRYYYPNLTAAWNYTTGGKGAARSAVRVDTIIGLKDYWDAKSTVPDFFRLDGTHRYHLIYGQTSARSNNLDKSLMWIDTIKIQLYGSPSDENWMDEYLGKVIGNGDGNGTGLGGGGTGSASADTDSHQSVQSTRTETQEFASKDKPLEKIDTAGKHVYEIAGGSVSYSLGSERRDYRFLIAAVFGLVFLSGAGISYGAYRHRMTKSGRFYDLREKI